jgi:histidinol-phosphate aminotransferase
VTNTNPSDLIARVVRDDVRAVKAYPVASSVGMVKLDAMENPYRLPDALRAELARALAHAAVNRYPDPTAPDLKAVLREAFAIPPECGILLGNGSDEIIAIVTAALARPDAVVLAPEPSFVMYKMNAQWSKMRYEGFALRPDFTLDVRAFLDRMAAVKPALVWIAYPNNPTGNLFAEEDVAKIIGAAPGLVVIDEAYNVFANRTFMHRLGEFPNLMVMRTVSKIGLAGIRLGYAAAHPAWIAELDKVRPPYNVSVLTQAAAEIVLRHMSVFDEQAERIKAERAELIARLREKPKVEIFPTDANFVLARVPDATTVNETLKRHKVLVRNFHGSHPLLANCLRLTVGTPGENQLLLSALDDAL